MDKLIAIEGPHAGAEFPLSSSQVIGRVTGNDIALPKDSGASRRHARLSRQGGVYTVVDLNSSNGTLVNGEPVDRAAVGDGDVLVIGTTHFRLQIVTAPAASPPPGARPTPTPAQRAPSGDRVSVRDTSGASTRILRSAQTAESTRGGLFNLDLSQMGGVAKLLVYGVALVMMLAIGYLGYWLASG